MSQQIRTVAVIGCGVIGMSWACLLLAKGHKVIITDPVKGAEDRFRRYLAEAWPVIQLQLGSLQPELAKNYEFVTDIVPRLSEVDFIQEVMLQPIRCAPSTVSADHGLCRTDPRQ
jgi:3-hydroxyacyl-CoA dehydrogenase